MYVQLNLLCTVLLITKTSVIGGTKVRLPFVLETLCSWHNFISISCFYNCLKGIFQTFVFSVLYNTQYHNYTYSILAQSKIFCRISQCSLIMWNWGLPLWRNYPNGSNWDERKGLAQAGTSVVNVSGDNSSRGLVKIEKWRKYDTWSRAVQNNLFHRSSGRSYSQ